VIARFAARLGILLGLRIAPASVAEPTVYRGERELFAGPAKLGVVSGPIAKLSADEALRCFGVTQGS